MSEDAGSLSRAAAAGVAWTTAQTWLVKITGMITIVVLARLLLPAEFGVVAIAMALPPLLQPLAEMGLSTYILQAEHPTRRTFSTFFWYSTVAAVVVTALALGAAPLVGALVGTPEVVPLGAALAPVAFLVVVGALPLAILRRQLRYRAIALQAVVAGVVSQIVAIGSAVLGAGAWALVWQTLVFHLIIVVMSWWSARFVPGWEFSRDELRHMVRFGVKVIGTNLAVPASAWVVNAVVAITLGPSMLGYLSIAQRLVSLAQELTTSALAPVTTVVFARMRAAQDRLRSGYLRAVALSYLVVGPVMVLIAVAAPAIVPLVFGRQWGPSAPVAQVLAVAALVATTVAIDNGLFMGLARPGTWFIYVVSVESLTAIAASLTARFGLVAFAMGGLVIAVAATTARTVLVSRYLEMPWWEVTRPFARLVPALAVATVAAGVVFALTATLPAPATLACTGLALLGLYAPMVRLTARDVWDIAIHLAGSLSRRGAHR